jgi:hypothetical protein
LMPKPWFGNPCWTGSSRTGDESYITAACSAQAELKDGAEGLTGHSRN